MKSYNFKSNKLNLKILKNKKLNLCIGSEFEYMVYV